MVKTSSYQKLATRLVKAVKNMEPRRAAMLGIAWGVWAAREKVVR